MPGWVVVKIAVEVAYPVSTINEGWYDTTVGLRIFVSVAAFNKLSKTRQRSNWQGWKYHLLVVVETLDTVIFRYWGIAVVAVSVVKSRVDTVRVSVVGTLTVW
jgi:hypothetical protein